MTPYQLRFRRSALRDLERLKRVATVYDRIWDAIMQLAEDPRPRQSRQLRGREGPRRRRVGDYRIIYTVDDDARLVTIVGIGHRRDIYR